MEINPSSHSYTHWCQDAKCITQEVSISEAVGGGIIITVGDLGIRK